mmetsp:Transcript_18446/g.39756  ORF Transcript_18446/g.39756 Transcript_18446/m.39756 type:complete len:219 (+) Transcript_18446:253-909(+)
MRTASTPSTKRHFLFWTSWACPARSVACGPKGCASASHSSSTTATRKLRSKAGLDTIRTLLFWDGITGKRSRQRRELCSSYPLPRGISAMPLVPHKCLCLVRRCHSSLRPCVSRLGMLWEAGWASSSALFSPYSSRFALVLTAQLFTVGGVLLRGRSPLQANTKLQPHAPPHSGGQTIVLAPAARRRRLLLLPASSTQILILRPSASPSWTFWLQNCC